MTFIDRYIFFSNIIYFSSIIIDLLVSICFPPLILITTIYVFALGAVFTTGGLIDFSTFTTPNIYNFIAASVAFTFTTNLLTPLLSAWLVYNIPDVLFQTVLSLATVFFGTFVQMRELFADLSRIFHWDFPIGVVPGAINWAIITDVTYSMYYLVPSIVFIVIQRWGLGRRMLLNLILFVADHPKGALYAISQIPTAWITPIMKIFKK